MEFYASPEAEMAAIRRAVARAGCSVRALSRGPARLAVVDGITRFVEGGAVQTIGDLECTDGWGAARLLLALAVEDAKTPGARALALRIRNGPNGLDDRLFAQAVQMFVKRIPFVREKGEIFQSGALTIGRDAGDCDDHFRLAYALGVAGGLRGALGVMHHGTVGVPEPKQGPAHAVALFYVGGQWTYVETTVDARFGENPNDAARRLGLTTERSDIAKELRIMTEQDLPPVPEGFASRNSAGQVSLDAEALERLGYLDAGGRACQMTDPTFPVLRRAVLAFQLAHGLAPDGLLGQHTRGEIARALSAAAITDVPYPTLGALPIETAGASSHLSDDFLRLVIGMADRFRAAGATAAAEDFLQVWTFESGINSHKQTNVINPDTGLRYENAGINQMGPGERKACRFGGDLVSWLALSNEEQFPFVECYYRQKVTPSDARAYRDAGSVYVATFAPAFLSHSGEPNFPLYSAPSRQYAANKGLDHGDKHYISVDDMRLALLSVAKDPVFVDARNRVRAMGAAPASVPTPRGSGPLVASLVFLGLGGGYALARAKGWL